MEHQRERTFLHLRTGPQTHLVTVAGGEAGRAMLAALHAVDEIVAVVLDHFLVLVHAAGRQHDALRSLEQDQLAVLHGEHAGHAARLILVQLLRLRLEEVIRRMLVLLGVHGIHIQHAGRDEVGGLLRELVAAVGAPAVIVVALRDRGLGRIGAEGARGHAVLGGLVDEPVAGLLALVEPHGDEGLLHAAAAALDPDILMILNIGFALQLALGDELLDELGVAQADATALTMDGILRLQDDDAAAVLHSGAGRGAAGVARADDDDLGLDDLRGVGLGVAERIGEEGRLAVGDGRGRRFSGYGRGRDDAQRGGSQRAGADALEEAAAGEFSFGHGEKPAFLIP